MDASGNNAFLTGPLTMPNGVTLLIDAGVTLYFSRNAQDYDTTSGVHYHGTVSSASNTSSCKNLITIKNVSNVGIMGYGKMNGRGGDVVLNSFSTSGSPIPANATWWDIANAIGTGTSQQNPRWIGISNATNATFYKITLKNAPNFHFAGGGNGVTFWGIKIITPYTAHNTDGIDPTGTNVTITHMSGSDGDDNVAAGSGSSNITVTHNRFFAGHGESIGSITTNGLSNILFDSNMNYGDADVDGTNSTAVRIKSADDRGGLVQNVQYSNELLLRQSWHADPVQHALQHHGGRQHAELQEHPAAEPALRFRRVFSRDLCAGRDRFGQRYGNTKQRQRNGESAHHHAGQRAVRHTVVVERHLAELATGHLRSADHDGAGSGLY